jgi:hypothetical protein
MPTTVLMMLDPLTLICSLDINIDYNIIDNETFH